MRWPNKWITFDWSWWSAQRYALERPQTNQGCRAFASVSGFSLSRRTMRETISSNVGHMWKIILRLWFRAEWFSEQLILSAKGIFSVITCQGRNLWCFNWKGSTLMIHVKTSQYSTKNFACVRRVIKYCILGWTENTCFFIKFRILQTLGEILLIHRKKEYCPNFS